MTRFKEIGVPGNVSTFGVVDSGEYLNKLDWPYGLLIYDEMRRSDSKVRAVLSAISLPIRRNRFYIEPATESPQDAEIAKFVDDNIFKQMSVPWRDTIRQIMLMVVFGFMPMEKVYWLSEEKKIKLKKLDPRMPMTITKFNFEAGTLVSLTQTDPDMKVYTIPVEKLAIFTHEKEGANWQGLSILRSVYGNWYIKKDLLKLDAIKHDRYGVGIPVGTLAEGVDADDEDASKFEEAMKNLYANEQGYVVLPNGYTFKIEGAGQNSSGTDVLGSVKYHDESIAQGMLAQFLDLGKTESGSRALGGSFIDFFLMSLQETADYIAEVISRFVIRELVDFNFNIKNNEYPVMKAEEMRGLDADVVSTLVKAGVISKNYELENSMRRRMLLPEINQEEYDKARASPIPAVPADGSGASLNPASKSKVGDPEEEEDGSKASKDAVKKDGKGSGGDLKKEPKAGTKASDDGDGAINLADLTQEEMICNLSDIEFKLNAASASMESNIMAIRQKQAEKIADYLAAGKKVFNISVPYKNEMHDLLIKEAKAQMEEGIAEVLDEAVRQNPKLKFADTGWNKADFMKWIGEDIEIRVEGASNKLLNMMAEKALDYKRQGMGYDEIAKQLLSFAMDKVSAATWSSMAESVVNTGWGAGRQLAGQKIEESVRYKYRSAILDGKACYQCESRDGRTFAANDFSVDAIVPDPNCAGKRRCRCMMIYVMKEEV